MISHCYILASSSYGNFNWRALLEWNESSNHYNGYTLDISSWPKVGVLLCYSKCRSFYMTMHIYNLEGETSQQNKEINKWINMTSDSRACTLQK